MKDEWTWVVTPAFARDLCMPQKFVDPALRGAEAIAYKLELDPHEENCGFMGNRDKCARPTYHVFNIYYKTGAIALTRDAYRYQLSNVASKRMLSSNIEESQRLVQRNQSPTFERSPFHHQTTLLRASSNSPWRPLGSSMPREYFKELLTGIDFVEIKIATGFTIQRSWVMTDDEFVLRFPYKDLPLSPITPSEAHEIVLPNQIRASVLAAEKQGFNPVDIAKEAVIGSQK
jgi:hypothetical protein